MPPEPAHPDRDQAECIFCKIAAKTAPATVLFEDDSHLVFFPLEHINPGHLLLIPKQHVDYLFDLDARAYQSLWGVAARLAPGLRRATDARRIGIAVEGFSVAHAHIHLVPVMEGNELNPTRARVPSGEELLRLRQRIHREFDTF